MVRSAGVEPTTYGFGGRHSIQLSYERFLKNVIRNPCSVIRLQTTDYG